MAKVPPAKLLRVFFSYWGLCLVSGISLQNPLGLAIVPGLWLLDKRRGNIKDSRALSPWIRAVGIFFAFMSVAATNRYFTAPFSLGFFKLGYILIAAAGLLIFWDTLLPVVSEYAFHFYDSGILFLPADNSSLKEPESKPRSGIKKFLSAAFSFLMNHPFALCMICWLPCYLYEYPGIISPDGIVQIEQIVGKTSLSDHHPVAHTALIALFMRVGSFFTNDINYQVSFYTAAQMVFLALCCRQVVNTLKHLGFRPLFTGLVTLFFALTPYNGVFSVFVLKDVPFSGVTALFTSSLIELCVKKDPDLKLILRFSIFGLALCVLRSNGIFAFAVCIPFMLVVFKNRSVFKKLLISCVTVLAVAVIYKGPVLNVLGAARPDMAESLSLPLQQVARVLVDGKQIEPGDMEMIERIVDTTWIRQIYAPDYADNVKELLRAGDQEYLENHKGEYFML